MVEDARFSKPKARVDIHVNYRVLIIIGSRRTYIDIPGP